MPYRCAACGKSTSTPTLDGPKGCASSKEWKRTGSGLTWLGSGKAVGFGLGLGLGSAVRVTVRIKVRVRVRVRVRARVSVRVGVRVRPLDRLPRAGP